MFHNLGKSYRFQFDQLAANQRYHLSLKLLHRALLLGVMTKNDNESFNFALFVFLRPYLLTLLYGRLIGNKTDTTAKIRNTTYITGKECVLHIPSGILYIAVMDSAAKSRTTGEI